MSFSSFYCTLIWNTKQSTRKFVWKQPNFPLYLNKKWAISLWKYKTTKRKYQHNPCICASSIPPPFSHHISLYMLSTDPGGALVAIAPWGMNHKKKKRERKGRKKELLQSCYATSAVIKLLTPLRHRRRSWGWCSIAWSV